MNFSSILRSWYSENKRDLPWRKTNDPYKIWLSEIILQQTQIKQGLPYYEDFVKKFPTINKLAKANQEDVLKLWQGLGYYSRARNMHSAAQHVSTKLHGKFPNNYKDLLTLKGVGEYTASAIASICFSEPKAVVDGNVYRVLARFFGVETAINSTLGVKEFKLLAQSLIDHNDPGTYNQAIMEFGALQCKPQSPNCFNCILNTACIAYQTNKVKDLPLKLKTVKVKEIHFNYLVFITSNHHSIFEKRTGKGIWQNLYQFPLIESKSSLVHNQIIENSVFKRFTENKDFEISVFNAQPIIHKLTHRHLFTHFWIVEIDSLSDVAVPFNTLKRYPTSQLISNFLEVFNLK